MDGVPDLIGGHYAPPPCKRGDWIEDERFGLVEVGGWTSAPIPWPYRKRSGSPSLILTDEMARAVRTESEQAIAAHWGVSAGTVWSWRKSLGVGRITPGTRAILSAGVPEEAAARGRASAATPEARARMAASKQGRAMHPNTASALVEASRRPKPEGWGKRANAWMRKDKE